MKFFLIGDKDTVSGFSLAGIEGSVVESVEDVLETFRQISHRPEIGIIIITERWAQQVRSALDSLLFQKGGILVVEIPDRFGALRDTCSVEELALSALGLRE